MYLLAWAYLQKQIDPTGLETSPHRSSFHAHGVVGGEYSCLVGSPLP